MFWKKDLFQLYHCILSFKINKFYHLEKTIHHRSNNWYQHIIMVHQVQDGVVFNQDILVVAGVLHIGTSKFLKP